MAKDVSSNELAPESELTPPPVTLLTPDAHKLTQKMDQDTGPVTSPYMGAQVQVYFRSGLPFHIPRVLWKKARVKTFYSSADQNYHLPAVPDEAGHVLIHYLVTGTYQTLKTPTGPSSLEVAVYVYTTALSCRLPALAALARARIARFADALASPAQVLRVVSEGARLLAREDPWLVGFVAAHVRRVLEEARAPGEDEVLRCFGPLDAFSAMLVRGMIQICAAAVSCGEPVVATPEPREEKVSSAHGSLELEQRPLEAEGVLDDPPAPEPEPDVMPEDEPAVEPEWTLEPEPEPEPAPPKAETMPVEEPEWTLEPEPEPEPAPAEAIPEPASESGTSATWGQSQKKKPKKKPKKKGLL
ncbi:hypothetical protein VD0002_g4621 [Verticillium dahliae]|uniref:Uncharacterized protein n=1 Tax=Verticillium dahliae TaxID=27337 RepID=A0AA44WEL5_VERDA|nr:hypothetical protein EV126DRAFT_493058 [Verticillium dahliae]PNH30102.1 hypothetical protein BJF96_g6624 [Verticillium dahliae]PNH56097.1 hypothetical protein VD0003_g1564 [Verticillium dahliae]PNH63828.1 hypothetical protein VD0002_g4621 [Verticillium dahliae]